MQAAREAMGLVEPHLPNLKFTTQDAFDFLQQHKNEHRVPYDFVLVDAFDGNEEIPKLLVSDVFGKLLASALEPQRGAVIVNVHNEEDVISLAEQYYGAMKAAGRAGKAAKALCFTIECVLVSARGLELPADVALAERVLGDAAAETATAAGFTFRVRSRASQSYRQILLQEDGEMIHDVQKSVVSRLWGT